MPDNIFDPSLILKKPPELTDEQIEKFMDAQGAIAESLKPIKHPGKAEFEAAYNQHKTEDDVVNMELRRVITLELSLTASSKSRP